MLLAPPKSPNGKYFIVPTGIRPVLQKTRIEVSYTCTHTHTRVHCSIGYYRSGSMLGCERHETLPVTESRLPTC